MAHNTQLSGEDAEEQNVIHILTAGASSEQPKAAASTACYASPHIAANPPASGHASSPAKIDKNAAPCSFFNPTVNVKKISEPKAVVIPARTRNLTTM